MKKPSIPISGYKEPNVKRKPIPGKLNLVKTVVIRKKFPVKEILLDLIINLIQIPRKSMTPFPHIESTFHPIDTMQNLLRTTKLTFDVEIQFKKKLNLIQKKILDGTNR